MSESTTDHEAIDAERAAQLDAADSGQEAGSQSAAPPDPLSAVIEKHEAALSDEITDGQIDPDNLAEGMES